MRSWKWNERRCIALQLFTARNEAQDCLSQFQQKLVDTHNQLNFAISNDVGASSIQLLKELLGIAKLQLFAAQQLATWMWRTQCL